ncbi:uncharacterized protein AMSG_02005 [Thecamonas trahens ATCC 50062]|uniref:Uncharacterized protein n=1 Tax=Thecamonas trahens ATCC 50062 TaxID=461836 RepID=A0A0L0DUW5_THETB|nr:hypothetical protein AMSG_02005 [Thecamonas trahens ATCC 50062]KNC55992.1 hypothetical protein AMSG_02005 [Thecamonas trahens ATCC 50062]|eukprot:XP_013761038.1 hypothetical protein AMSG_02005 [Thecamonas trahens ATCC 50062]
MELSRLDTLLAERSRKLAEAESELKRKTAPEAAPPLPTLESIQPHSAQSQIERIEARAKEMDSIVNSVTAVVASYEALDRDLLPSTTGDFAQVGEAVAFATPTDLEGLVAHSKARVKSLFMAYHKLSAEQTNTLASLSTWFSIRGKDDVDDLAEAEALVATTGAELDSRPTSGVDVLDESASSLLDARGAKDKLSALHSDILEVCVDILKARQAETADMVPRSALDDTLNALRMATRSANKLKADYESAQAELAAARTDAVVSREAAEAAKASLALMSRDTDVDQLHSRLKAAHRKIESLSAENDRLSSQLEALDVLPQGPGLRRANSSKSSRASLRPGSGRGRRGKTRGLVRSGSRSLRRSPSSDDSADTTAASKDVAAIKQQLNSVARDARHTKLQLEAKVRTLRADLSAKEKMSSRARSQLQTELETMREKMIAKLKSKHDKEVQKLTIDADRKVRAALKESQLALEKQAASLRKAFTTKDNAKLLAALKSDFDTRFNAMRRGLEKQLREERLEHRQIVRTLKFDFRKRLETVEFVHEAQSRALKIDYREEYARRFEALHANMERRIHHETAAALAAMEDQAASHAQELDILRFRLATLAAEKEEKDKAAASSSADLAEAIQVLQRSPSTVDDASFRGIITDLRSQLKAEIDKRTVLTAKHARELRDLRLKYESDVASMSLTRDVERRGIDYGLSSEEAQVYYVDMITARLRELDALGWSLEKEVLTRELERARNRVAAGEIDRDATDLAHHASETKLNELRNAQASELDALTAQLDALTEDDEATQVENKLAIYAELEQVKARHAQEIEALQAQLAANSNAADPSPANSESGDDASAEQSGNAGPGQGQPAVPTILLDDSTVLEPNALASILGPGRELINYDDVRANDADDAGVTSDAPATNRSSEASESHGLRAPSDLDLPLVSPAMTRIVSQSELKPSGAGMESPAATARREAMLKAEAERRATVIKDQVEAMKRELQRHASVQEAQVHNKIVLLREDYRARCTALGNAIKDADKFDPSRAEELRRQMKALTLAHKRNINMLRASVNELDAIHAARLAEYHDSLMAKEKIYQTNLRLQEQLLSSTMEEKEHLLSVLDEFRNANALEVHRTALGAALEASHAADMSAAALLADDGLMSTASVQAVLSDLDTSAATCLDLRGKALPLWARLRALVDSVVTASSVSLSDTAAELERAEDERSDAMRKAVELDTELATVRRRVHALEDDMVHQRQLWNKQLELWQASVQEKQNSMSHTYQALEQAKDLEISALKTELAYYVAERAELEAVALEAGVRSTSRSRSESQSPAAALPDDHAVADSTTRSPTETGPSQSEPPIAFSDTAPTTSGESKVSQPQNLAPPAHSLAHHRTPEERERDSQALADIAAQVEAAKAQVDAASSELEAATALPSSFTPQPVNDESSEPEPSRSVLQAPLPLQARVPQVDAGVQTDPMDPAQLASAMSHELAAELAEIDDGLDEVRSQSSSAAGAATRIGLLEDQVRSFSLRLRSVIVESDKARSVHARELRNLHSELEKERSKYLVRLREVEGKHGDEVRRLRKRGDELRKAADEELNLVRVEASHKLEAARDVYERRIKQLLGVIAAKSNANEHTLDSVKQTTATEISELRAAVESAQMSTEQRLVFEQRRFEQELQALGSQFRAEALKVHAAVCHVASDVADGLMRIDGASGLALHETVAAANETALAKTEVDDTPVLLSADVAVLTALCDAVLRVVSEKAHSARVDIAAHKAKTPWQSQPAPSAAASSTHEEELEARVAELELALKAQAVQLARAKARANDASVEASDAELSKYEASTPRESPHELIGHLRMEVRATRTALARKAVAVRERESVIDMQADHIDALQTTIERLRSRLAFFQRHPNEFLQITAAPGGASRPSTSGSGGSSRGSFVRPRPPAFPPPGGIARPNPLRRVASAVVMSRRVASASREMDASEAEAAGPVAVALQLQRGRIGSAARAPLPPVGQTDAVGRRRLSSPFLADEPAALRRLMADVSKSSLAEVPSPGGVPGGSGGPVSPGRRERAPVDVDELKAALHSTQEQLADALAALHSQPAPGGGIGGDQASETVAYSKALIATSKRLREEKIAASLEEMSAKSAASVLEQKVRQRAAQLSEAKLSAANDAATLALIRMHKRAVEQARQFEVKKAQILADQRRNLEKVLVTFGEWIATSPSRTVPDTGLFLEGHSLEPRRMRAGTLAAAAPAATAPAALAAAAAAADQSTQPHAPQTWLPWFTTDADADADADAIAVAAMS